MLNFREIQASDLEILKNLTKDKTDMSCENNFVNLFVWQKAYKNKIAIEGDSLFIKYNEDSNATFRLPIGGNLEEGIKKIIDFCGGELPVFWNPWGEALNQLPQWFRDSYDVIPTREGFDYIYLQSDLATLSGKKYHSKRNHISAFSKTYDWHYEKITEKNLASIIKCSEEWFSANSDRADKYMEAEKEGIYFMLHNMELLSIKGGAIFIGEKAVAFTLGTPISSQVFDVCTEKALPEYAAAYTVINKEFVLNELGDYKYINREDDMGLEGLRKAKLSYKPTILLEKYLFVPKLEERKIYRQSFSFDLEFEQQLFDTAKHCRKTLEVEGETVSQLFLLPCSIVKGEAKHPAYYIFAAATAQKHRGKGYMTRLLNDVIADKTMAYILRPATEDLIEFYKKSGFTPFAATDSENAELSLKPTGEFEVLAALQDKSQEGEFTLMSLNSPFSLEGISFPFTMP